MYPRLITLVFFSIISYACIAALLYTFRESEKALHKEIKASLVAEGAARVTDVTHQLDRCKADLADRDTEMG